MKKQWIDDAWYKGKKCGKFIADEQGVWLEKKVQYVLHHYFSQPGWACDVAHITRLERLGGLGVRLIATDRSGVWESFLSDWDRYSRPLNKGEGLQRLLPDAYWRFTETRQRSRGAA